MLATPMDVLHQFPVRKSKKQKQAFRDAVQSYVTEFRYETRIEKGSLGVNNLIIGDPTRAKYLITAHYDTCARLPFPNLITPCNFLTFILYQLFTVVVMFSFMAVFGVAVWGITKNEDLAFCVAYVMLWVFLILMMVGPANKHNANDNTSGVVTLLEIARTMPENQRNKVAFVLFDLEESGLIGSSAYRKAHKAETDNQVILNLDCVGDGKEIVFFPTKKIRKDQNRLLSLRKCVGVFGERSIAIREKGFSVYPSDQNNFPYGVGIAAFNRKKGVGLYCSRIHTHKDTVLEETNVNILRAALTTLISSDAAQ